MDDEQKAICEKLGATPQEARVLVRVNEEHREPLLKQIREHKLFTSEPRSGDVLTSALVDSYETHVEAKRRQGLAELQRRRAKQARQKKQLEKSKSARKARKGKRR